MDAAPHGSWPLHVVVVGFNRPHSLARLVRSLASAEYAEGASISVRFALDFAANASVDAAIDDVVHSLAWPHGAVSIRRRRQHAGLRDNILGAWQPRAHAAPALFLEDDLEVSSLWWRWVQACLGRYASPPPPELIGISLFTPDDMNEPFVNAYPHGQPACQWQASHARARGGASAVLFGQPCSWGAVYFAAPWRRFLRVAKALTALPALPSVSCPAGMGFAEGCSHVAVNRWGRSSWKRLLVLHMLSEGLVMLYPNLPQRTSFSTNHVEQGVHVRTQAVLNGQRARHRVGLITKSWCERTRMPCDDPTSDDAALGEPAHAPSFELPHAADLRRYDFYCAPAGDAPALRAVGESLRALMPPAAPDDGDDDAADEDVDEGDGDDAFEQRVVHGAKLEL